VSAREYSLNPARVMVGGPGELRIKLRNRGSLPHDVRLERGGRDVGGTPPIPGGHSAAATVALHPGRYELLCTVGDHAQLGMRGVLHVKE
jgi:plastocyanin